MGLITDFVIAEVGIGGELGAADNPSDHWPTLQAKGVETIKLATLFCAITGVTYHNNIQKSFPLVGGNEEEGPWVFLFPPEILAAIAGVETSQVAAIAQKWAATEDLSMDGWSVPDASIFIRELAEHASKAAQAGKHLYLRLCL